MENLPIDFGRRRRQIDQVSVCTDGCWLGLPGTPTISERSLIGTEEKTVDLAPPCAARADGPVAMLAVAAVLLRRRPPLQR